MKIIHTNHAPQAIGTYSQAVLVGNTVYISGQIPLDPKTMTLISGDFRAQATQAFENLKAIVTAAKATFAHIAKLQIYLRDMNDFATVNEVMSSYFEKPYPARAAIEVSRLPKDALIEIDAVLYLGD